MAETPKGNDVIKPINEVSFTAPAAGTPAAEALAANAAIKVTKLDKGLAKFRGMKRPKMKSLNLVKKLNKTTKKKKNKRHFSRVIKGKVIDGVNELYTLTAGIMLALRCSIGQSSVSQSNKDILTVEDFSYVQKLNFPASGGLNGNFRTPPHGLVHTFKFKSYAPKVFLRIRDFFGMTTLEYMLSVCGNYNYLEFISNSKSGQFFFYSHDGKYMIKTQTKEENKFMKRILPHYYKYVTENPHTLLVRILGMHRVKMYHLRRKVHFVIMSSVFDTPEEIHQIYDLKGSLVGRNATAQEKASGGVLKDQDLLDSGIKFRLGSKKAELIKQLRSDAMFLASLNIMDYSLLVGMHDRNKRVIEPPPTSSTAVGAADNDSGGVAMTRLAAEPEVPGASKLPFRRHPSAVGKTFSGKEITTGAGIISSEEPVPLDVLQIDVDVSKKISGFEPDGDSGKRSMDSSGSNSFDKKSPASAKLRSAASIESVERACIGGEEIEGSESEISYDTESEEEDEEDGDEGDSDLEGEAAADGAYKLPFPHSQLPFSPTYQRGGKMLEPTESDVTKKITFDSPEAAVTIGSPVVPRGPLGSPSNVALKDGSKPGSRPMSRNGSFLDLLQPATSYQSLEGAGVDKLLAREDNRSGSGHVISSIPLFRSISREGSQPAESPFEGNAINSVSGGSLSRAGSAASPQTFGLGATKVHPWTSRQDGGINCRLADGSRGNEIYYMGVIDILQQYNVSKKAENFFKVCNLLLCCIVLVCL